MGPRLNLLLILAVVAVIVIRMSVFTVDTREYALKFQVGRIARADYQPGLHFKIPFFENVARYPKTILNYDEGTEERFLTGEKKNVIVDYFVTWRIVDPSQYYRSVRGDKNSPAVGKFTHPSAAPNNDLLVVWTPGPANDLDRPTTLPYYDAGLYVIPGGNIVDGPEELVEVKND